jgi:outer membrane protein assembly factor BamB
VTLKVVMPTDWLMVEHDEARSGIAADETTLSTANVGTLALSWSTVVDASVTAQPLYIHSINVGGQTRDVLLIGTGGNSLYLLDASNGSQIWKRNFGASTPNTWGLPDGFGIEAPPVIDRVAGRIYTVSTDGNFHTLALADGTDVYTPLTMITNPVTNKVWGGLNKVGNYVYIPSASNGGDVAPWRGQVYQVNVSAAPALAGDFVVVPSIPAPNGGGGIWGYGGVSADLASGNIYAASADDSNVSTGGKEGYTPYSDSILALNNNVGLLGYYQATQPSTYSCTGAPCDLDFASTPLIFQPAGCSQMLAVGNKNGNLYLFRSADLIASGQPLQILNLNAAADSLGSGGIGGTPVYYAATNMLYVTTAGPGVTGVAAGLVAMNVTGSCTLQVAWSNPLGGNDSPNSTPTIANGIVFVGQGNTGVIHSYNANTGTELWHSGTNYGSVATFAAPIVAGGKLYAGSWTSFSGGGIVGAFSLPAASFTISGTVSPSASGSGTLLALSGAASASATADSSGNYSFAGLANGTYTVTPSKTGFTFSPPSQTVTVNNGNMPAVNFAATAQTWSISGNVSANGANANVALSGPASASTTADSSGNYSFTGLANGIYTVTPTKSGFTFNPTSQNATVNNGNVSSLNFTATSSGSTGLAIDANVSTDGTTAKTTISTPAFSTKAANELIVAFVATDYLSGTNTTVASVAGGGLNWALVKRTNVQSGGAEIWAAFASTALTNVTITATISQSVVSSITVMSFTGVDTTSGAGGPNAIGATGTGNSSKGAPTASLVTTRNNSWVVGVGNDYDNAINRTPGTGQTVLHQFLTSTGDTYWVQMQTATTPLSGSSVTINDTAPSTDRYNLSTVEVRTP